MGIIYCIFSLLEKNQEVVLPSFGKFKLEFCSVKKDSIMNKVFPPNYIVSFEQPHKLDDYSLIHELERYKMLGEEKARELFFEEIASWKNILKNNEPLVLRGLGIFTSNKEKIIFKESNDCIFYDRSYGLPLLHMPLKIKN